MSPTVKNLLIQKSKKMETNQTQQKNENELFLREWKREIYKKIPTISQAELNFNSDSPKFNQLTAEVVGSILYDEIGNICEVYYGRNRDKISLPLINSIISFARQHLGHFTLEDFSFSFKRAHIEATQYTSLTLGEFTQHLNKWNSVKLVMFQACQSIHKRSDELRQNEIKAKKFELEAQNIYNESLIQNNWLGTPFHASVIAEKFANDFTREEKDEFFRDAKIHVAQLKEKFKNSRELFNPAFYTSETKYFYEIVVKQAISRGIQKFKIQL